MGIGTSAIIIKEQTQSRRYDSLGAIAGEVENPSTTFPRALWASMALTISLDMLVMITGVVAVPDASE
jgi:amino acid transporter